MMQPAAKFVYKRLLKPYDYAIKMIKEVKGDKK
jgi:hypothetical protein